jgi:predicted Zn-dependent protease
MRELLSADPDNHFGCRQMSEILFRAGRADEALPFARRASVLLPQEPFYQVHLAEVLLNQNILEEATAVAKSVTITWPNLAMGWRVFSRVLWAAGDRGTGLIAAYEANKLEPSPFGLYTYATYLAQLGSYSEAVDVLRQVIKAGTDFAGVHLELARYLLQLKRTEDALTVIKSALQRYPYDQTLIRLMQEAEASTP